jgi:hypothetical protein
MTARRMLTGPTPLLLADKTLDLAGPTGPQAAAVSASPNSWTAQTLALRPAR